MNNNSTRPVSDTQTTQSLQTNLIGTSIQAYFEKVNKMMQDYVDKPNNLQENCGSWREYDRE